MRKQFRVLSLVLVIACLFSSWALAEGTVFSATNEQLAAGPEEMIGEKDQFAGLRIGFSQRNIAGSEWYEQLVRLAKSEAEYLGIELTVMDGRSDLA